MAKEVLGVPLSSAPVEPLFSIAGKVFILQCSPPNSNFWGAQTGFDLLDFLDYENSFQKAWLAIKAALFFNMVLSGSEVWTTQQQFLLFPI